VGDAVLTINAGSSSIKFSLFEIVLGGDPSQIVHGQIEGIGAAPHFVARGTDGNTLSERRWAEGAAATHEDVFGELLPWIETHLGGERLAAVGHRVVHGGRTLTAPVLVTEPVLRELESLIPLAPLHQPHNLSAIRAVTAVGADLRQVACFDTAFHRTHASVVSRFALPRELIDGGIERYGFHGLSYEYIASRLPDVAPGVAKGRVVAAHLGNGASLCALSNGRSIDTTMGFTALDGLPMGTRCGALDPGVILYLQQARRMSPAAVEDLLYRRSGLLGVSGISGDMRTLLASDDRRAAEAVDLFAFRIARETGALAVTLGGLDGLVFTAGIGEHAPEVRRRACQHLHWLGVDIDAVANAQGGPQISSDESRISVWVIPTDEETMIARHTLALLDEADQQTHRSPDAVRPATSRAAR
jgi:acetate kinase